MDLNRVGVAIGAIALVLAIPLAVIANLLTPFVREWYATSSDKRLRRRLDTLCDRLQESERQWTFSKAEWLIYRTIVSGIGTLSIAVYGFWTLALLVLKTYEKVLPPDRYHFIHIMAVLGYLANLSLFMKLTWVERKNRTMHSIVGREELRKEIDKLRDLLNTN